MRINYFKQYLVAAMVAAGLNVDSVVMAQVYGPTATTVGYRNPAAATNGQPSYSPNFNPNSAYAPYAAYQDSDELSAPMASEGCASCESAATSSGGCGCDGRGELGDPWTLFGRRREEPRLNIGGWFQGGYHSESNNLFNSNPDRFNLHQGWLFVEKEAVSENGELGLGFRFDGMYGTDFNDTIAFGNPVRPDGSSNWDNGPAFARGGGYGWALPQTYLEVAQGDWSVKVGHFFTLIGYEVVTAPDNFFYSHSMTMYNSEPFTHTGALASYSVNDDTTVYGGWTAGWDTGFDQFGDGSNFLGGITTALGEYVNAAYMTTIGDFGLRGSEGYMHSIVLDMTLTERMNYVVQSDLLRIGSNGQDSIGINQFLFYDVTERLRLGSRFEWWKADSSIGYAPHGATLPATGTLSYYQFTNGFNYRLNPNVIMRPEYRYDFSEGADYEQGYFGIDMIATY